MRAAADELVESGYPALDHGQGRQTGRYQQERDLPALAEPRRAGRRRVPAPGGAPKRVPDTGELRDDALTLLRPINRGLWPRPRPHASSAACCPASATSRNCSRSCTNSCRRGRSRHLADGLGQAVARARPDREHCTRESPPWRSSCYATNTSPAAWPRWPTTCSWRSWTGCTYRWSLNRPVDRARGRAEHAGQSSGDRHDRPRDAGRPRAQSRPEVSQRERRDTRDQARS